MGLRQIQFNLALGGLSLVAVGVKLFPFNGKEFRRVLCRLLTLLGHNDASQVTLKSFKAGRATSQPVGTPLKRSSLQANGNRLLS